MIELFRRRSGPSALIKLNQKDFTTYVRGSKDYHVMVMFTAVTPERGCSICAEASEEFKILANSIRYTTSPSDHGKIFFVSVDYDEHGGADIFQQMKLKSGKTNFIHKRLFIAFSILSLINLFYLAPAFILFPPNGKSKKDDNFEVQKHGYQAETLASWIQNRAQVQIRVYRPPNYSNVGFVLFLTCSIAAIMYMKWSRVNNFLNRETVAWVSSNRVKINL